MGSWFTKLFKGVEAKILMIGLDRAGKTSILYKTILDENVTTISTVGFNVENIKYKDVNFITWDIGGSDKIRYLWRYYYSDVNAIIFVVDLNDKERMDEACDELHKAMKDDKLKDAILLVFANKQDLPNALSPTELTEKLKLENIKQKWFIQPCCASNGEGIFEGFEWILNNLK